MKINFLSVLLSLIKANGNKFGIFQLSDEIVFDNRKGREFQSVSLIDPSLKDEEIKFQNAR